MDVQIPLDLWQDDLDGSIQAWLVVDGSRVEEQQPIAEIILEKAIFEVVAPVAGQLRQLKPEEALVRPGDTIGSILS